MVSKFVVPKINNKLKLIRGMTKTIGSFLIKDIKVKDEIVANGIFFFTGKIYQRMNT